MELKLTAVGNSVGLVLPKELLNRLGLAKGDSLFVSDVPDGIQMSISNPELGAQMEVARRIMKERYNVLRELAK